MHTYTHTRASPHFLSLSLTHTHAHTHARTHARTHTTYVCTCTSDHYKYHITRPNLHSCHFLITKLVTITVRHCREACRRRQSAVYGHQFFAKLATIVGLPFLFLSRRILQFVVTRQFYSVEFKKTLTQMTNKLTNLIYIEDKQKTSLDIPN